MIVTRFAPSPTGFLHLGHAFSAWFAWQAAHAHGGRFLLRIEDIDPTRCRPEFEDAILEDLAWLGLAWNGPVRRQSDHIADYQTALAKLDELGVVYPCFCSRKTIAAEIAAAGGAPHGPAAAIYPGICRSLSAAERQDRIASGAQYAIRLNVSAGLAITGPLSWHDRALGWTPARPETLGDTVIARRDAPTSYHLAVTADDHSQGVNLVTRGEDLFAATHIHRLLQALLGYDPPAYHHHRLHTDAKGARLSKRDGATAIRLLRDQGKSAEEVRVMAGWEA